MERPEEKTVYKCCCEKCANRNVVNKKYYSLVFGVIDKRYCSNGRKVIFENVPKCEIEIYCKNYKENKSE